VNERRLGGQFGEKLRLRALAFGLLIALPPTAPPSAGVGLFSYSFVGDLTVRSLLLPFVCSLAFVSMSAVASAQEPPTSGGWTSPEPTPPAAPAKAPPAPSAASPATAPAAQPAKAPAAPTAAPPAPTSRPAARTYEAPPANAAPASPRRSVSLTFSPLHLLFPVAEVTGEFRLADHVGVAVIGGIGSVRSDKDLFTGERRRFSVYEFGGQVVAYPFSTFDKGFQVGAEILYVGVKSDDNYGSTRVTGAADGLAVGPFVGYKFVMREGLTLALQGGVEYLAARGEAKSSDGDRAEDRASAILPLLNVNLGWSF
jgi:hypothetical protein